MSITIAIIMLHNCGNIFFTSSEVAFDLTFHNGSPNCDKMDGFSEGVEFSVNLGMVGTGFP